MGVLLIAESYLLLHARSVSIRRDEHTRFTQAVADAQLPLKAQVAHHAEAQQQAVIGVHADEHDKGVMLVRGFSQGREAGQQIRNRAANINQIDHQGRHRLALKQGRQ